jgi:hypothetical protein
MVSGLDPKSEEASGCLVHESIIGLVRHPESDLGEDQGLRLRVLDGDRPEDLSQGEAIDPGSWHVAPSL